MVQEETTPQTIMMGPIQKRAPILCMITLLGTSKKK